MPRPLFRKTIAELEQLSNEWRDSPERLRSLKAELDHRTRPKAVRLRERVEATLAGDCEPREVRGPARQTELWPGAIEEPRPRPQRVNNASTASTNTQDYLAPPDAFTLVQPMGVRPRPSTFRPTLKEDLLLDISDSDPPAKVFRVALFELIREMRRRHVGHQQFSLENGVRVPTDLSGSSYQFEFGEEANLFEGAKVDIVIGGRTVPGQLTGILQGRIIVTLQEDFGDRIFSCILRIDNTALLQALHDRIAVIERGEADGFRSDMAASVLDNAGSESPPEQTEWPWPKSPTQNQSKFVGLALANDLTWLWGPPGTGKTETLSALAQRLYDADKRVLICSNTNRAVDQLLQKLCCRMEETGVSALADGRIVRLGRIEDELEEQYGDLITPDKIVERRSKDLVRRRDEIEATLERLGRAVAFAQNMLARFEALDAARRSVHETAKHAESVQRELGQHRSALSNAQRRCSELNDEAKRRQEAGVFRRLFMRDEATIRRDTQNQHSRIDAATQAIQGTEQRRNAAESSRQQAAAQVFTIEQELAGENRDEHRRTVREYDSKQAPLRQELAAIAKQLADIRNSVLREARIVGATVTRTFLRPVEFASFDAVIIDEASMILLPAVFHAAGLAREKVVIAGDFRQLPPIIQTEQQSIHGILAPDIFDRAGINMGTVSDNIPRLVMLDEQFRMDDSICKIVSDTFYRGFLRTSPTLEIPPFSEPEPLSERLTVIDTSHVWPFTTRNAFESRLNLMHALTIRNLVLHLREQDHLFDQDGRCRVGICTPYAAQAKLLRDVFRAHSLDSATLRASTVHGFQGNERPLMILDLVDSVGERRAGIFLQANQEGDSGTKLMNVALSRAQEGLVIVGNLTFLDGKLPSDAYLRGLLFDIQRQGHVIDVRDVLALHPILEDLKTFGSQPDLDPESLRTGLFKGRDFARLCRFDMERAERSIVVFSAFITPERAAQMGDVFRGMVAQGVKIKCVTRPPNRNGTMPEELGRTALSALEAIGVAIDLRNEIHEKVVLIDNRITWFGSLNPLSHTSRTTELMARVDDTGVASHLASILSLRRRSAEDFDQGAAAEPENPRCELCDGWSVLIRGRFGPFFRCAQGCDWKQSVDKAKRKPR